MKKLLITLFTILLIGTGCQDELVQTQALNFDKVGNDYQLVPDESAQSYNQLIDDLNALNQNFNADSKIAVLATSTANIVDALDMNIVASISSDSLNEDLQAKLASGEIVNLASALEPNLETLYQVDYDVLLVGSNMPHVDKYSDLDNLVVLPQEQYSDIFYTSYALMDTFDLGQTAQHTFNSMVELDQEAKALVTDEKSGDVAMLKYAYGNVTIAPDSTYAGSLLTELGVENMYGNLKDVDLPMDLEKLLTDDPDTIILYAKGDDLQDQLAKVSENESLENLTAYQNQQIYILESQSLNVDIASPQTLLDLSEELYGS